SPAAPDTPLPPGARRDGAPRAPAARRHRHRPAPCGERFMKIGFAVNQIETEEEAYTTTRLALAATNLGAEAWLIGVADCALEPDGKIRARARGPSSDDYRNTKSFRADVRGEKGRAERISVSDLDVLMLRNDPAEDFERPWAQTSGFIFGE